MNLTTQQFRELQHAQRAETRALRAVKKAERAVTKANLTNDIDSALERAEQAWKVYSEAMKATIRAGRGIHSQRLSA